MLWVKKSRLLCRFQDQVVKDRVNRLLPGSEVLILRCRFVFVFRNIVRLRHYKRDEINILLYGYGYGYGGDCRAESGCR